MKSKILIILTLIALLCYPKVNFGQAPNLGAAATFSLFTAIGAINNTGTTIVTGDIGTNAGAFNGFPPGIVNGQIHVADATSLQAATDVTNAYGYLAAMTCGVVIGTTLGSGQTLTPNVYCLGAVSSLSGDLILDGQGNPDALFIFKINGALSTSTFSNIVLINSASSCNVYWQINGEFSLGNSSVFRGTVLNNGAINLLESSSLIGRGLSVAGAITLSNNIVSWIPAPAIFSITGNTGYCAGGAGVIIGLSGSQTGVEYQLRIDGINTGGTVPGTGNEINFGNQTIAGIYTIVAMNLVTGCQNLMSGDINVSVWPVPLTSAIYHQ